MPISPDHHEITIDECRAAKAACRSEAEFSAVLRLFRGQGDAFDLGLVAMILEIDGAVDVARGIRARIPPESRTFRSAFLAAPRTA